MASAIPVPGQPGRLFIPDTVNYMKTNDVVDMDAAELATLQGLHGIGRLTRPDLMQAALLRPQLQQAAALKQELIANKIPALTAALAPPGGTASPPPGTATPGPDTGSAPPATVPPTAPAEGGLMAMLKNPYYIAGAVLVLGAIGFILYKRSKRSTLNAMPVETMGLEELGMDMEKPKRKRRRSKRKSKK